MSVQAATLAPFKPSALNRFYAAVERLPGGGWRIYPLLFVLEQR